jgi:hypothetical protein
MAYSSIISLQEAKNYLRIDTDFTEDDLSIQAMLKSAIRYVENHTQHYFFAKDVQKVIIDAKVRVYDYPLNSLVSPTENVESKIYPTWTEYTVTDSSLTHITVNVGYEASADVPEDLKQVALFLLDMYYYGKEGEKSNTGGLPQYHIDTLNFYKRFII